MVVEFMLTWPVPEICRLRLPVRPPLTLRTELPEDVADQFSVPPDSNVQPAT